MGSEFRAARFAFLPRHGRACPGHPSAPPAISICTQTPSISVSTRIRDLTGIDPRSYTGLSLLLTTVRMMGAGDGRTTAGT
jgi:hypothetical protein